MDDGFVHIKRFVVLRCDEDTFTVVINSEINPILQKPELLISQVSMPKSDHDFMDRDSNIDCTRVRTFSTAELIDTLIDTDGWFLGKITDQVRDQMLAALKQARTLSAVSVKELCESLEKADLNQP
jgi:hypothetical protein